MSKVATIKVYRYGKNNRPSDDLLASEEPMEIRLIHGLAENRVESKVAVTMRTPGNDFELTSGFLFSEGIINSFKEIVKIRHCEKVKSDLEQGNVVIVDLDENLHVNLKDIERNFYTSSSCGVCGKGSIESLNYQCKKSESKLTLAPEVLVNAPEKMRGQQDVFKYTGGLHAAALFNSSGKLIMLREDIGRHNAMDKLTGACLAEGLLPLKNHFIVVSGRLSFELVQKALSTGLPIIAAIGSPSSLAVDLAEEYNMTLLGFLKKESYNIYTHKFRINEA